MRNSKPGYRIAFTIGWSVALGLYFIGLPLLWGCEGIPLTSVASVFVFACVICFQDWLAASRKQAHFLTALACLIGLAIVSIMAGIVHETFHVTRIATLIALYGMIIGLVFTWTSIRKALLLAAVFCAATFVMWICGITDPIAIRNQKIIGHANLPGQGFAWIDQWRAAAWFENDFTTSTLNVRHGEKTLQYRVGPGTHQVMAPMPGAKLTAETLFADGKSTRTTTSCSTTTTGSARFRSRFLSRLRSGKRLRHGLPTGDTSIT